MHYTEILKQAGIFGAFTRSAMSFVPGMQGVNAASSMAAKLKKLWSAGANKAVQQAPTAKSVIGKTPGFGFLNKLTIH